MRSLRESREGEVRHLICHLTAEIVPLLPRTPRRDGRAAPGGPAPHPTPAPDPSPSPNPGPAQTPRPRGLRAGHSSCPDGWTVVTKDIAPLGTQVSRVLLRSRRGVSSLQGGEKKKETRKKEQEKTENRRKGKRSGGKDRGKGKGEKEGEGKEEGERGREKGRARKEKRKRKREKKRSRSQSTAHFSLPGPPG